MAVVPVAISGSWRLLRYNLLPVPFGTRIHVRIGDPMARRADEDRPAMLREVREQIEKALAGRGRRSGAARPWAVESG